MQVGGVIQRSLVEFCKLLDYGGKRTNEKTQIAYEKH